MLCGSKYINLNQVDSQKIKEPLTRVVVAHFDHDGKLYENIPQIG